MGENLLKNGDFEADWGEGQSHQCLVLPDKVQRSIGNVFTPPGWATWFYHRPGEWDQPEVRDVHVENDPVRVHGGKKAMLLFTFYRKHDAGFQQCVEVTPGTRLRLSAFAHAWSNHNLEGHDGCTDNPRCSCGVGQGGAVILHGDAPDPTGDSWNDAIPNFTFYVGIDPTGGCDPFADTVVWGRGAHIYNEYAEVPAVEVEAQFHLVTVFLRSFTLWAFKHNDAYWDDVVLEAIDEQGEGHGEGDEGEQHEGPGSEEPHPYDPGEEEPVRGAPRVQYHRTYVLLPPGADAAWARAVIDSTWDDRRYTLGGSADDAGVGNLDDRTVIAVNPHQWPGSQTLEDFLEEHYPGATCQPLTASTPAELAVTLRPPLLGDVALSQNDAAWCDLDFGEDAGGWTIGERGCLLTDFTMALRKAYGVDVTPPLVDRLLVDAGAPYTDDEDLVGWDAAVALFGAFDASAKFNRSYTLDELARMAREGWVVVLRVQGGAHFVLMDCVAEDDTLHVIDPYDGQRKEWPVGDVSGIRAMHLSDPPPPAPEGPVRGVHDFEGGAWMVENGLDGWCVGPVYVKHLMEDSAPNFVIGDAVALVRAGLNVIVNLRYSWAVNDGGHGTLPGSGLLGAFEAACVQVMRCTVEAVGEDDAERLWFVYGNEMNNTREHPEGTRLGPDYYVGSYNRVWAEKPDLAQLGPGAIDPYNPGWGDWRVAWGSALHQIAGAQCIALHAYTHGHEVARIRSTEEFSDDPLRGVYYDFQVLRSQRAILPQRFQGLPQFVTEMNPGADGSSWQESDGEWVEEAYRVLVELGIRCGCLYRYGLYDRWGFANKPGVLQALWEVVGG